MRAPRSRAAEAKPALRPARKAGPMAGSLGRAARAGGRPDEYDDMARTTCSTRWACRRRRAAACALLLRGEKQNTSPGRCTDHEDFKGVPVCPKRECGCKTRQSKLNTTSTTVRSMLSDFRQLIRYTTLHMRVLWPLCANI